MAVAKRHLRAIPQLEFFRLMGTGAGAGFSIRPNFGVFSFFGVWPNIDVAKDQLCEAPVFRRYFSHAKRSCTFLLEPVSSRGAWDGFELPIDDPAPFQNWPVVALTRATINPFKARAFWRHVPAISDRAEQDKAQCFMIGTGELPWFRQVTFSVWRDEKALRRFARQTQSHGVAAKRAFSESWFLESCFSRFNLLGISGDWPGLQNVSELLEPRKRPDPQRLPTRSDEVLV
ncbi:spheroidene monooxygenase [Roseibium hamelinense]|nr:spheroidene monooxygenase [Roseibium hamelinense]MTI44852.1 spheroidene monooxygenase [Roseibium hamelinense]